jgi:uncharacterized protein YecT (DUF1311 family)
MRIATLVLGVIVGVALSDSAHANYTPEEIEEGLKSCETRTEFNQITDNACAGYRAAKAELRLTRAYHSYRAMLKVFGGPRDTEHLLKVQRAWIAYREASCESHEQGTMMAMLYASCMQVMADERAAALEGAIQAECDRSCEEGSDVKECRACAT